MPRPDASVAASGRTNKEPGTRKRWTQLDQICRTLIPSVWIR